MRWAGGSGGGVVFSERHDSTYESGAAATELGTPDVKGMQSCSQRQAGQTCPSSHPQQDVWGLGAEQVAGATGGQWGTGHCCPEPLV